MVQTVYKHSSNFDFTSLGTTRFFEEKSSSLEGCKDGLNWYAYVENDPVNYVDLWGLEDVHFLFTLKSQDPRDQDILDYLDDEIDDLADQLRKEGYFVNVDKEATKADVLDAFADDESKALVIMGHANQKAGLQTSDMERILPVDITDVGNNLSLVVIEACQTSLLDPDFTSALGFGVDVVDLDYLYGYTRGDGAPNVIDPQIMNDFNSSTLEDWLDNSLECSRNENN